LFCAWPEFICVCMHQIAVLIIYNLCREAWYKVTVQFPPLSTSSGSQWQGLFWGHKLCVGKRWQHRKVQWCRGIAYCSVQQLMSIFGI
jgi:hypothetical protein